MPARLGSAANRFWRWRRATFSSIDDKPPRIFSAPGLLPVRSWPVRATACSRHNTASTIALATASLAARFETMCSAPSHSTVSPTTAVPPASTKRSTQAPDTGLATSPEVASEWPHSTPMNSADAGNFSRRKRDAACAKFARVADGGRTGIQRVFVRVVERHGADRLARRGGEMRDPLQARRDPPPRSPRRRYSDCGTSRRADRDVRPCRRRTGRARKACRHKGHPAMLAPRVRPRDWRVRGSTGPEHGCAFPPNRRVAHTPETRTELCPPSRFSRIVLSAPSQEP